MIRRVLIIGGATASNKTNLATKIAKEMPSVIINADSMQVYKDLEILSNRPTKLELEGIENKLFGVLETPDSANLGWWSKSAKIEITNAQIKNKIPIIVGGTGLYLRSLEKKISYVPEINDKIRTRIREIYSDEGLDYLYEMLRKKDYSISKKIHQKDKQRILRALEVKIGTGKSLNYWREKKNASKNIDNYIFIIVETSRDTLYKNINERFKKMIEKGLVKEVRSFMKKKISSEHPINKMIGLKHIKKFISGEINLDEAISLSQRDSRRYAKRQITWFKHQPQNAIHFSYSDAYNYLKKNLYYFLDV